jgi:hypothetical protein
MRDQRFLRPHLCPLRPFSTSSFFSISAYTIFEQLTLKENRRRFVSFHTINVHVAFAARCSFQLSTKERSASHVYKNR